MNALDSASEREMPVLIREPRLRVWNVGRQPFAVRERHELIMTAMQHQHRRPDLVDLKPPGLLGCHPIVEIAVRARCQAELAHLA